MRGILILCGGSGAGRRGYGQRRERGWPKRMRPAGGVEERGGGGSSGGAKDGTSETPTGRPKGVRGAAGCGRGDGTPGRRGTDEVPEGRRDDEAAAEKGRWQGAGSAGRRGYGQRRERGRPKRMRPAGGVEERGGGGVARTAEGNGRRERGTRTRRPEGVRLAGGSRKEEVGKRAGAAGSRRRPSTGQ